MRKLKKGDELKVGMILRKKVIDTTEKLLFGEYVVFKINGLRGYVFGSILSECKSRDFQKDKSYAFYIKYKRDKTKCFVVDENSVGYWVLNEQEGLLYEL